MADNKAVQELVLEVCRKHPQGASQSVLDAELGSVPPEVRVSAINALFQQHRLLAFQQGPNLLYKEQLLEDAQKFKGLSDVDRLVYQVIKQAGTSGVWTKDMKVRTNLAQPQLTKILKVLEQRRLVKSVKNVNNPSRKVYMLYELEPSRELTGGAWYTENQFDSEFIGVLQEACYRYIRHQGDATLKDLASFVRSKGFSKVDLRLEDIEMVVNTLIYDGRVDQVEGEAEDDMEDHYRPAVMPLPSTSAFTSTPCGVCPVFNECHEDGLISPQTCVYYDKWL